MDTQLSLMNGGMSSEPESAVAQPSLFPEDGAAAGARAGGGGTASGAAADARAGDSASAGSGVSQAESASRTAVRRTGGLLLVDAAYAPDSDTPVCARCWSSPQVKRVTRGVRGSPRGWGAASTDSSELVDGKRVTVIRTIYRCSNAECETAIALHMLVTGGYVPRLVDERRLTGEAAARFRRGRVRRDGVWLAQDGRPHTARDQMEFGLP